MSDRTPTNEDTLLELIRNCPKDYHLRLQPSCDRLPMIEVYQVPNQCQFEYLDEDAKQSYHTGATFTAVGLHPQLWCGPFKPSRTTPTPEEKKTQLVSVILPILESQLPLSTDWGAGSLTLAGLIADAIIAHHKKGMPKL